MTAFINDEERELVREELMLNAQRYPAEFRRAVQAVHDHAIDGADPCYCFYGRMGSANNISNRRFRLKNARKIYDPMYELFIERAQIYKPMTAMTCVEQTVHKMRPGRPYDEKEQEFQALCKEVLESCSPVATGSEEKDHAN